MANDIKIRVNSAEKIEQVLQEAYDLTCKAINEIQNEMNKLTNSSPLGDASMDEKVKYANAMHNYIGDKKNAISQKVDIAKLMTEIYKANGNVKEAMNAMGKPKAMSMDLNKLRNDISKIVNEEDSMTYELKKKKDE